eukprot:999890-Rhodomonas_salina.3
MTGEASPTQAVADCTLLSRVPALLRLHIVVSSTSFAGTVAACRAGQATELSAEGHRALSSQPNAPNLTKKKIFSKRLSNSFEKI